MVNSCGMLSSGKLLSKEETMNENIIIYALHSNAHQNHSPFTIHYSPTSKGGAS
jgi:hypothetical protein